MKVKELMEILSDMHPKAEVCVGPLEDDEEQDFYWRTALRPQYLLWATTSEPPSRSKRDILIIRVPARVDLQTRH